MSVTVADLLQLPSLKKARLAAGAGGLNKPVTTISVLEYALPDNLQDALFQNNEFFGSEIVITGFMNIPTDVEAQCANLRRLAHVGEVGLILYYVGVFVPRVDQRLIDLANELDFALIVMPEGRMDLRYSEVICEVMEAVFKDQNAGSASLVSDILKQVSLLPEHRRTLDSVLKLLRDQIRATAILATSSLHVLHAAAWPRTQDGDFENRIRSMDTLPGAGGAPLELPDHTYVYRQSLTDSADGMELFLIKEGDPLHADTARRAGEVVRLAASLWDREHGQMVMSELVRAILRDEPLKMRRLAEIFHVDVASIHTMWVLKTPSSQKEQFRRQGLALAQQFFSGSLNTIVADYYEENLVLFLTWPANALKPEIVAEELEGQFSASGLSVTTVLCQELATTADVRSAYLSIQNYLADALLIWPLKDWHTLQEITFAGSCRETVSQGEEAIMKALSVLKPLESEREGAELIRTLQVYLLDSGRSALRTAELLYFHKNTVKYRLQRAGERLGYSVDKLPETFALYTACAIRRLLKL